MRPPTDAPAGAPPLRALVVDADPALRGLLAEWLRAQGFIVCDEAGSSRAYDLIVVDVPFPRRGLPPLVQRISSEHPHTPLLALSANFLPGVESGGAVARALGVAAVLPKPVTRNALANAVHKLLRSPA